MSQFSQIQLLYTQLGNMAEEVYRLLEKELYDYVLDKMDLHEKLILQINLIKKCTKFSEEEQAKIDKIAKEVKAKEKKNLDLLSENMQKVKIELNKINLRNKIQKAYDQAASEGGASIIDVDDSYEGEA